MIPRSASVRGGQKVMAAVALLMLTAMSRAGNTDAGLSIVAGLDDLNDLAPPGPASWRHDVREETCDEALQALRRCELSTRGLDELQLLPPAEAAPQGDLSSSDTRHQLGSWTDPILATGMDARPEPMFDLETARKLIPPELMARLSGPPRWSSQSHEERTAHLVRHIGTPVDNANKRRLQWRWEGSGTQARDDSLATVVVADGDGDESQLHGCTDPLASNTGTAETSCTYDCTTLQQEFFPGLLTRCFIYDTSTQTWPAELLGMRQQRLETHTFVGQGAGTDLAPGAALAFTVGIGRSCQNVTIASTMIDTQDTHMEVVCLVDGEHEYNHTVTTEHSVDVIGYAESGVHVGAGGTTSFVVGECTDALIRVTTTGAGDSPITWSLDDGGHNGPWTFDSSGGVGVHEHVMCMFDNEYTLTHQGPASSWQGSVEVVGFIQYHNTITIPNNENWIVQGNVDPVTGLPVLLDARLSSGTTLDRSHANIVVRDVRLSGQIAPVDPSPQWVGHGSWFVGQGGSYGGAFRFEGGNSDHSNPVRLTFHRVIFDHNTASSGGAVMINGRAGHGLPDSSAQNWDSGIAATWDDCVFFRNFAAHYTGAFLAVNVWPMTFAFTGSAFIQNSAQNNDAHDAFKWDNLAGLGPDRRVGLASLVHKGTVYDGGWLSEGLVASLLIINSFMVNGIGPDDPDATWNVTLTGVTVRDHATILAPMIELVVYPFAPEKMFRLNVHVSDLAMSDAVALMSHSYDGMYSLLGANQGVTSFERSRFESNGCFNVDAKGLGGLHHTSKGNLVASYANSEWVGNAAGNGAAMYTLFSSAIHVDQCLFRNNVATLGGGAIYFGSGLNTVLLIERSIFEANAVRPPQTDEGNAPATVVVGTRDMGEGAPFRPVWRIDDGPVHGIGWDVCQAVIERSQWSVQQGFPPWIPTGSELPSSCANESYHVQTTYSTTEMLTAGEHMLWHGVVTKDGNAAISTNWIKIDDVTPPIFPVCLDYRQERFPGCAMRAECTGPNCCPLNEVFWSSTPFRVSTGRGGAVAAEGSNHVTIRDSVFRGNEAPGGASVLLSSTLTARIMNTTIDEPTDVWSSSVSEFAATVATCYDNPCPAGSKCTFMDHSTNCEPCGPNELGADGISCAACHPGTEPNGDQTQCVQCASGLVSSIGICTFCAAGKTSSADRTGCIPCPPGTQRGAEDDACLQCPVGTQSSDGVACGTCPAGASPTTARDGCTACEAGKHSADGLECISCSAGAQPNLLKTGCDSCTLVGPNAFSPEGMACRDCPARNSPNYERTSCFCQANTYSAVALGTITCHGEFHADGIDSDECAVCPPCLDCTVVGTTVLKSGWSFMDWGQAGESGDAYRCPGAEDFDACPPALLNMTAVSTCASGYTGPVCGNCELGYTHLKVGKACSPCDDGRVDVVLLLALFCIGLVLAGIAITGVLSVIQEHGIVTDARILVGFFQILSQAANVFDVNLPFPAPELISIVKLVFLDVRKIIMVDCWVLGGFYGNIVVNTIVVPVVIGGICGLTYIYRRKTLQAVIDAGAADEKVLDVLKVQLQQNLFFCIFLVYPTITTTLFRVPQCEKFGDEAFHEDDYSIDCNTSTFMWTQAVAVLGVILVPIGVPAAFTFYMLRAKQRLSGVVNQTALGGAKLSSDDINDDSDTYGFLTKDYRPECWYYEIVKYGHKLLLGGISVLVGRATMAQSYFVIMIEAAFLVLHVRTYPFVVYKHNVIEAFGHCSLMLLYAATLILRDENEDDFVYEWFPREGYGWVIVFLFGVLLPSPSLYFYFNAKPGMMQLETEFGQYEENPLAIDAGDGQDGSQQPPAARAKIIKVQREAKEMRAQIQKLQKDNASLRKSLPQVEASRRLQASNDQGNVEMLDGADTETPTKTRQDAMKEFVANENLSEEARESAKKALGMLVTSQIVATEQVATLDSLRSEANYNDQFNQINQNECGEEMARWLRQHRLLHRAAKIIRVVGANALPEDLEFLTEEDIETVGGAMTNVEKMRLSAALQALRDKDQAAEPTAADPE